MAVEPSLSNRLMKPVEVAAIFGVRISTVRGWIASGKIKGIKVNGNWRIEEKEMRRLANAEHGSPE